MKFENKIINVIGLGVQRRLGIFLHVWFWCKHEPWRWLSSSKGFLGSFQVRSLLHC